MGEKHHTPAENSANQQNPNKGTKGTNQWYDKSQGNRGKQLNPNQNRQNPSSKK